MVAAALALEPPWDPAHAEQWTLPPAAAWAVLYGGVMASGRARIVYSHSQF